MFVDLRNWEKADASPAPKKSRFGEWEDDDDVDSSDSCEVELDLYLKVGRPKNDDPSKILSWWRENSILFPRLAQLARGVLSIPATSASSERTFSRAGFLRGPKLVQRRSTTFWLFITTFW